MDEVFGKKKPTEHTYIEYLRFNLPITKSLITCIFSDMRCADASHSTGTADADAVFGLDVDLSDTRFVGWAS